MPSLSEWLASLHMWILFFLWFAPLHSLPVSNNKSILKPRTRKGGPLRRKYADIFSPRLTYSCERLFRFSYCYRSYLSTLNLTFFLFFLVVWIHKCTLSGLYKVILMQTEERGQDEGRYFFFLGTCLKWIRRSHPRSGNSLLDRSFERGQLDICVCVFVCVYMPAAYCIQSGIPE